MNRGYRESTAVPYRDGDCSMFVWHTAPRSEQNVLSFTNAIIINIEGDQCGRSLDQPYKRKIEDRCDASGVVKQIPDGTEAPEINGMLRVVLEIPAQADDEGVNRPGGCPACISPSHLQKDLA
jgi:hypothetical protein